MAHAYIDALAPTGVNTIKFQVHLAEAESSIHEKFRVNFSYQDATRYDYWKRMEFTQEQWAGLKQHCEEKNIEFLASPFSVAAVELLESIGCKRYKIGSGEMQNLLMLDVLAQTGKPIILSSGMSNMAALDAAVNFLKQKAAPISLLQCTTAYPTAPEQWGLNVIPIFKERYKIPIGFSDHSGTPASAIAAVALGAELVEFHTVFDKRMFGPDATSSLNISEVQFLTNSVRQLERSLANKVEKDDVAAFESLIQNFGKSLSINQNLEKGTTITQAHLESKKPAGLGIPAAEFEKVIGRKITKDISKWSFLNWDDLS